MLVNKFLSFAAVLVFATGALASDPLPAQYLEKVEATPDFCQGDHRFGKFPSDGTEICAPVATSNALMWLNQHGYPRLLNKPNATQADQANLIRQLCDGNHMNVDVQSGTPPQRVIAGLETFLKQAGYSCKVEQMGWRNSLHSIGKVPNEDWISKSCLGASNVLINVGWYKAHQSKFQRLGGHWVTVVGFKQSEGHRLLLIHDPSPRGGLEKMTEACRMIPLPPNHFLEIQSKQTIDAHGYCKLEGIHVGHKADLAIVDGAVAFTPGDKAN